MIDLTGKTLANRYDLLALIGTGGMGSVYRAHDRELDELVALKVIRHELAELPAMAERFRHEVKLARRVTHVNVARTFELGNADGVMFCTMELIDGEALTARLSQRRRLPAAEAVSIAIAMCDALEAAHAAGVIHRDIKPDNVLLAGDGRVVLADFGVAAVAAAEGELSGTPAYMAPDTPRAMEMLEQAHRLAPDEPRLAANLAIAHVRMDFFLGETSITSLARARELAQRALALAPQLADSHIAAGHVALNVGDAVEAAARFRTAVACAPHLTEAHEQLGRLLLEAGFIDVALARLDETLRIAVGPRMVRWDIGRAWVLEGRWDDYLAIQHELEGEGRDRPMSRVRYMWWQLDLDGLREFRRGFDGGGATAVAPEVIRAMLRVFLDGAYTEVRGGMQRLVEAEAINARRRAFVAQMAVEAGAFAGDPDGAFAMLDVAIEAGLFDLHWLDRCPLLAPLRADPRWASRHAGVKARAEAILDALYGDRGSVATQDTLAAT